MNQYMTLWIKYRIIPDWSCWSSSHKCAHYITCSYRSVNIFWFGRIFFMVFNASVFGKPWILLSQWSHFFFCRGPRIFREKCVEQVTDCGRSRLGCSLEISTEIPKGSPVPPERPSHRTPWLTKSFKTVRALKGWGPQWCLLVYKPQ